MQEIIQKGDIISITGAGGKTSLMFYLSENLVGKKVVTTSTKIFKPEKYRIVIDSPFKFEHINEIIVTAKYIKDNKLVELNEHCFDSDYDYILIEADGSRRLQLKGYGENEPVISDKSMKTIGVVDITAIGLIADDSNVFRLDELRKITNLDERITMQNLVDLVINKNGIFKNTKNVRVLFITKCEMQKDIENANKLAKLVADYVDYIVIGSVKEEKFLRIK